MLSQFFRLSSVAAIALTTTLSLGACNKGGGGGAPAPAPAQAPVVPPVVTNDANYARMTAIDGQLRPRSILLENADQSEPVLAALNPNDLSVVRNLVGEFVDLATRVIQTRGDVPFGPSGAVTSAWAQSSTVMLQRIDQRLGNTGEPNIPEEGVYINDPLFWQYYKQCQDWAKAHDQVAGIRILDFRSRHTDQLCQMPREARRDVGALIDLRKRCLDIEQLGDRAYGRSNTREHVRPARALNTVEEALDDCRGHNSRHNGPGYDYKNRRNHH
jgi:hypothetical protein